MPSAAALVPLPMDDTTPPVTKIYLVSLIYTPKNKELTPLPSLLVGIGEEKLVVVRRGLISSRKPLLRHTCMDLYHTTSGPKMKQEIAQRYSARLDPAQTRVAILSSLPLAACPGAATERSAQAASSPARLLPAPHSSRPSRSHHVAWPRTRRVSFWRHTSYGRSACL